MSIFAIGIIVLFAALLFGVIVSFTKGQRTLALIIGILGAALTVFQFILPLGWVYLAVMVILTAAVWIVPALKSHPTSP